MCQNLKEKLSNIIFSASGWRGIFAKNGNEESKETEITEAHVIIASLAASVFSDFVDNMVMQNKKSIVLGLDTRPTGMAIMEAIIKMLIFKKRKILFLGICSAPEIISFTVKNNKKASGFIYISASHNPIGHNGIKFGLNMGGVINAEENASLVSAFNREMAVDGIAEKITRALAGINKNDVDRVISGINKNKKAALKIYKDFTEEVISGLDNKSERKKFFSGLKREIIKNPPGIVCDFNGSARTLSIDRDFIESLGAGFYSINDKPGEIVHRIVPEEESLFDCRDYLSSLHEKDRNVVIGYVPDCDGDRGNFVIWNDKKNCPEILDAQTVFALACVSELSSLHARNDKKNKIALIVNDPTSIRINKISTFFNAEVFRAEVGEANLVSLAKKQRESGYIVRILGEGSSGGTIIHPSTVRDPLNTLGSLIKILKLKELFKLWCSLSNQTDKYRDDYTLSDIISSLPVFYSTGAYSENALLNIKSADHALLKKRYQEIFNREWDRRKQEIGELFGIDHWQPIAYNGITEKRNIENFEVAGRGGLKIEFFGRNETEASSFIWMRGSGTEPVFRIMADSHNIAMHDYLLKMHREIILEADKS